MLRIFKKNYQETVQLLLPLERSDCDYSFKYFLFSNSHLAYYGFLAHSNCVLRICFYYYFNLVFQWIIIHSVFQLNRFSFFFKSILLNYFLTHWTFTKILQTKILSMFLILIHISLIFSKIKV